MGRGGLIQTPRGEPRRGGLRADEALGVGGVRAREDLVAATSNAVRLAAVDAGGSEEAEASVVVHVVVPVEDLAADVASVLDRAEAVGEKPGRYLMVLNCASEYGLSSETCGRL